MTEKFRIDKTQNQISVSYQDDHGRGTTATMKIDGNEVFIDQFSAPCNIQTIAIDIDVLRDLISCLLLETGGGE